MKNLQPGFDQLLEEYVFKMATQWIESVTPLTQTKLINLYSEICPAAGDVPSQPATQPLSGEWDVLLNEPVDKGSVHRQWLLGIVRERDNRYAAYIAHLKRAIVITHDRSERLQLSSLQEPRFSQLVAYYDQTLTSYQQQLALAQKARQSNGLPPH